MPVGKGRVSVESLRRATLKAADRTSVRQVARDVGMSPSGLQKFLSGASPYSATRTKLERWYVRSGRSPDSHSALAALEVLVQDLPPAERTQAMSRLVEVVEKDRGGRPPSWIKRLRSRLEEGG